MHRLTNEGDPAPELSVEQLQELKKMAATKPKKKRTTTTRRAPAARRQGYLYDLAQQVRKQHPEHWDPRITIYVDDAKTLKELTSERFTPTNTGRETFRIGGYDIREVGALHRQDGDKRVVEVKPVE